MDFSVRRVAIPTLLLCSLCMAQWGDLQEEDANEVIEGGHTVLLTAPITDEISNDTKRKAYENFKDELFGWLEVNLLAEWNTKNGIDKIHLERFARGCSERAKQDSRFDGPKWTYKYSFPAKSAAKAAEQWNTRHDALAVQAYVKFKSEYQARNAREAYVFGIRTVYHSRAHIGAREAVPGETGKDFVYEANVCPAVVRRIPDDDIFFAVLFDAARGLSRV